MKSVLFLSVTCVYLAHDSAFAVRECFRGPDFPEIEFMESLKAL